VLVGSKDVQQAVLLRRLAQDLFLPGTYCNRDCDVIVVTPHALAPPFVVDFVVAPTIRDRDGVALSSRNANLSPSERSLAPKLLHALHRAETVHTHGEWRVGTLQHVAREKLSKLPVTIDYVDINCCRTMELLEEEDLVPSKGGFVVSAAVTLPSSGVRLLDNIVVGASLEALGRGIADSGATTSVLTDEVDWSTQF
jgi:pantoate--beta-alanine ligase